MVNAVTVEKILQILEELAKEGIKTDKIPVSSCTIYRAIEKQGFNAEQIVTRNKRLNGQINIGNKLAYIRAKKQELSEEERKDLIKYGILGKRETKHRKSRPKIETSQFIDILKTLKQVGLDTGKITTDSHTLREELERQGFNADGIVAEHAELDGKMNIGNRVGIERRAKTKHSEEETKILTEYGILGERKTGRKQKKTKSKEVSEEKLIKEIAKLAMKRNVKMSQLQEICDSYGVAIEDVLAYIQQLEIPFENDLE